MHLNIGSGGKNGEPKPVAAADSGDVDGRRYGGDEDFDSACSTPFVSAPSSPARGGSGGRGAPSGYFFSAPASPVHYVLSSSSSYREKKESGVGDGLTDFEFSSSGCGVSESDGSGAMSSADELFLNGKIRPMKLSSHLQRPQGLTPLLDLDEEDAAGECEEETVVMMRGRELRMRNRSLHRKTRSLSPLRNSHLDRTEVEEASAEKQRDEENAEAAAMSSSSRSSSSGSRNSKKWIFLKDLLYRSKSEGRASTKEKFWPSISLSPSKDKKTASSSLISSASKSDEKRSKKTQSQTPSQQRVGSSNRKAANGSASMRRVPAPPSAHELHYTANRAQAEELKKKTYLPYRQGLFGCLGFSSKGYGALRGLTSKTLNPVSSS